jgi:hypothetical protein
MNATDSKKFKFIFALMGITLLTITSSIAFAKDNKLEKDNLNCTFTIPANTTEIEKLKTSEIQKIIPIKKRKKTIETVSLKRVSVTKDKDDLHKHKIVMFSDDNTSKDERLSNRHKLVESELLEKLYLEIDDKRKTQKVKIGFGEHSFKRVKLPKKYSNASVNYTIVYPVLFEGKNRQRSKKVEIQLSCSRVSKEDAIHTVKLNKGNKNFSVSQE